MRKVADVLDEALARWGLNEGVKAQTVVEGWDDLVGPQIAAAARPIGVSRGTLRVAVKGSVWAQELRFAEATILERLNARAGNNLFKSLRFEVRPERVPKKDPTPSATTSSEMMGATPDAAERIVAAMDDDELRAAFRRAINASLSAGAQRES